MRRCPMANFGKNSSRSSSSNVNDELESATRSSSPIVIDVEELENEDNEVQVEVVNQQQQVQQGQRMHPWPHLESYFKLKSFESEVNAIFTCQLCQPLEQCIKAHLSSLQNLKKHIASKHSIEQAKFEELCKVGSKRGKKRCASPKPIAKDSFFQPVLARPKSNQSGSMTDVTTATATVTTASSRPSLSSPTSKLTVLTACPSPSPASPSSTANATILTSLSGLTTPSPSPSKASAKARPKHQATIWKAIGYNTGNSASQEEIETAILDFVIENMLPLQCIESPSFHRLVKKLDQSKDVPSRRTLGRRMTTAFGFMEQKLNSLLENQSHVATTADCWTSAGQRAYLGVTCHWLEKESNARQHAIIAFQRLQGSHTGAALASELLAIHAKFSIDSKVVMTTTDNGANFVKAFRDYGIACRSLCEPQNQNESSASAAAEPDDIDTDQAEVEDDEASFGFVQPGDNRDTARGEVPFCLPLATVPVADQIELDHEDDNVKNLPMHMRCASHTLNLVGSTDAIAAIEKFPELKQQFRKTIGKAQGLWNAQGRSSTVADTIQQELKKKLLVPNSTRWNSMYNSISQLNDLFEAGMRTSVNKIMISMNKPLPTFQLDDATFLKEYHTVMTPVAKALDLLQGEKNVHLGVLLPTIASVLSKLDAMQTVPLNYCTGLLTSLQGSIIRRFEAAFDNTECLLAAGFHPRFRLTWLKKYHASKCSAVQRAMEVAVQEELSMQATDQASASSDSDNGTNCNNNNNILEDDLLDAVSHPLKRKEKARNPSVKTLAKTIVQDWLNGVWRPSDGVTDAAFKTTPVIHPLFVKFNTPLPSSAAVERLFSVAKDVLRAKRAPLADSTLTKLLLLRENRHLIGLGGSNN
ncbi:hypothetical protein BOX15_Mlig031089g1 [Macrostomum lignano]|uniref:BED-type domain-containing protein n=1 Tax=Macrostomum lignano TaxID=282301 RepID=A0A267FGG1_9PLAT|nr:hypothetical protein BOX15_Mlig031089g1 [Macrostomum lignano]